jgi:hypothetical protein
MFAPGRVRDPKGSAEKRGLLLLPLFLRFSPYGTRVQSDESEGLPLLQIAPLSPTACMVSFPL